MTDESRRHSGGGGGGSYSRKRRYRDDDRTDRYRQQRRRYEEPVAAVVRKQLSTIAESSGRKAEEDVVSIAKLLVDNCEDEGLKFSFREILLQLVIEQPMKIPFVAAVILHVNANKPETISPILTKAGEQATSYIADGNWRNVKLLLRFFGCLQGILEGEGVFPLLEELFSRAVDLQTASSEDSLGLELVKVILYTIPYVMASSASGFEPLASALLEKTDIIASTPHTLEALVDTFPPNGSQEEVKLSALALLQKQLQDESEQLWKLLCIPRPWTISEAENPTVEQKEAEDSFKNPTKHALPTITVPNPVKNGPRTFFPEVYFSVYAEQEISTVPQKSDIASSLIRDALVDTINVLDFNRNAAAKFLIDVDCFFAPGTFVTHATAVDKLQELASEGQSTWKSEDVAIDAAFSQLFQLPAPEHKLVYYHSVLTEACKIAPTAIAPSLGRAIRFLYRNAENMDLSLEHRFLDWFAHHLSNFGFTWKWAEWMGNLDLPDVHPKKAFIIGTIDKEIRLSFAQRIKGTLPEPYQALITEGKEKDTPDFKFAQDGSPFSEQGQEVMKLIRQKSADEEIERVLSSVLAEASASGVPDPLIPSTDVFVTAICYVGSKSLSHFLSCIERCKERLLAIGPQSPAARRQIISSVMDYWVDQPGVGINIIDKLLNYTILTPLSVLEWALIDHIDAGVALAKPHIFEMIAVTMRKVTGRMRQIVAARTQPTLFEPQLSIVHETLVRERAEMESMFKLIENSLLPVEQGSGNNSNGNGVENGSDEVTTADIIRNWAKRWLSVYRRKTAVEHAFIEDAMLIAAPVGTVAPLAHVSKQDESDDAHNVTMTEEQSLDVAEVDENIE